LPITFINGSITDLDLLQHTFKGVTYIFHQAAIPSVPRSIENPLASYEASVTGTLNVLIAARDNKVKKVVFASSSSVFGDTPTLPKHENMLPNPLSPYAANKVSAEYHCLAFNKAYGLPVACLRWEQPIGFAPQHVGDNQKVEFFLYKDGAATAEETLHLWVNVRGGRGEGQKAK
jgi:nucleoside-diphosphate-sugar epimerase